VSAFECAPTSKHYLGSASMLDGTNMVNRVPIQGASPAVTASDPPSAHTSTGTTLPTLKAESRCLPAGAALCVVLGGSGVPPVTASTW
jgi:hypothetical protein